MRARRSRPSSPRTCAACIRLRLRSSGTSSRPSRPSPTSARRTRTCRDNHALLQRARCRHADVARAPALAAGRADDPRLRSALPVHPRRRRGRRARARGRHDIPGVYNGGGGWGARAERGAALLGKRAVPLLPPYGTGLASASLRRLGMRIPPEMATQLRYGRGLDNRKLKSTGFRYGLHDARDRASSSASTCGCDRSFAGSRSRTSTRRRSRTSCAGARVFGTRSSRSTGPGPSRRRFRSLLYYPSSGGKAGPPWRARTPARRLVLVAGALAYDSTRNDLIADGVLVAGVDVGGLHAGCGRPQAAHRARSPSRAAGQGRGGGAPLPAHRQGREAGRRRRWNGRMRRSSAAATAGFGGRVWRGVTGGRCRR